MNWLHNELHKGEYDIRCGRTYPAEEVFEKLRSEIRLIENEQEKKYMGSRLLYYIKHNSDNWEQEINDRLIRTSHKGSGTWSRSRYLGSDQPHRRIR